MTKGLNCTGTIQQSLLWWHTGVVNTVLSLIIDYHTLRVGGLVFAGVIVFLSIIMLAGKTAVVFQSDLIDLCVVMGNIRDK